MRLANEIWISFRALPVWVQIWVTFILVPVNSLALVFLGEPNGVPVALLAIGGMLPNIALFVLQRGFSKAMAISHLILWVPLVLLVFWLVTGGQQISAGFRTYLLVLLLIDFVSLAFDFPDALKWVRGDRNIAGKQKSP